MTTTDALAFVEEMRERIAQLGDRTSEGANLARAGAIIVALVAQIDALDRRMVPPDLAPTPSVTTESAVILDAAPDAHVGAVGGE